MWNPPLHLCACIFPRHLPPAGEGASVPPQATWGVLAGAPSAHPNKERVPRGSLPASEELSPGHTGPSGRRVVGLCLGVLTDQDGLTAAWRTALLLQRRAGVKARTELTPQDTRPPCSSAGEAQRALPAAPSPTQPSFCFVLLFWPHRTAYRILVPRPGTEPALLRWKGGASPAGLPGKPSAFLLK